LLVGDRSSLGRIRFVTPIPTLNCSRRSETFGRDNSSSSQLPGLALINGRFSTATPSSTKSQHYLAFGTSTPFTRLFSDPSGADPYSSAVSDVYQDLFGEGIFHGKAIFDSKAFHQVLANRFPEDTLLSHDLIEGAHVRVAYASDIELFEQFPVNYQSYMNTASLDSGLADSPWIWPMCLARRNQISNTLSVVNRWKIRQPRRSLFQPPCRPCQLAAFPKQPSGA
jgi:cyclic beta-1,2-glucan synthetase